MDTASYSTLLWRRKWLIAGTLVVTLLVVALGTLTLTPTYQATATLRVKTAARGSLDWVDYDIAYTERLMNTYARLATSDPILQEVAQRGIAGGRGLPVIRAEVVPDTELMTITAEGEDPALVAEVANTLTAILVNQSEELYAETVQSAGSMLAEDLTQAEAELAQAQADYAAAVAETPDDTARLGALSRALDVRQEAYTSLLSQYERARIAEQMRANSLSIVELATVPSGPSSPNVLMNLVLAGLLGLGGGLALAMLFQKMDRSLYTPQDVEAASGLPVLAEIGDTPHWRSLIFGDGASYEPEMYHRLRTSLSAAMNGGPFSTGMNGSPYTLLITSTQPGEGKSMVATNLAMAMGQAGRRVVVVEGNLHRPAVHTNLGLHNEAGLTTVLEGKWRLEEAIQMTPYPGVWALTSGPLRANPVEMLSTPAMAELLEALGSQFDVVLIDGPSVLGAADAAILVDLADAVVLVVNMAQAGRDSVQAARAELDRLYSGEVRTKAAVLGVVANRVHKTEDEPFRRYYDRSPAARAPEAPALPGRSNRMGSSGTTIRVPAPDGTQRRRREQDRPAEKKQHELT